MDLTGKLKLVFDEKSFPSGFTIREFVITTEERYPQDIIFTLQKEKTELIKSFSSGDKVKVHFDVRGREYQGKYYNSLVAWRIDTADGGSQAPPPPPPPGPGDYPSSPADDDLPF